MRRKAAKAERAAAKAAEEAAIPSENAGGTLRRPGPEPVEPPLEDVLAGVVDDVRADVPEAAPEGFSYSVPPEIPEEVALSENAGGTLSRGPRTPEPALDDVLTGALEEVRATAPEPTPESFAYSVPPSTPHSSPVRLGRQKPPVEPIDMPEIDLTDALAPEGPAPNVARERAAERFGRNFIDEGSTTPAGGEVLPEGLPEAAGATSTREATQGFLEQQLDDTNELARASAKMWADTPSTLYRDRLVESFKPYLEKLHNSLRDKYGDTVTVYRAEHAGDPSTGVRSFSLTREGAEDFLGQNYRQGATDTVHAVEIPVEDIQAIGSAHQSEVLVDSSKHLNKPSSAALDIPKTKSKNFNPRPSKSKSEQVGGLTANDLDELIRLRAENPELSLIELNDLLEETRAARASGYYQDARANAVARRDIP